MTPHLKAAGIAVFKRNESLRIRYRKVRDGARRLRYRLQARDAIDDRCVIFEAFVGRSYAGSPRAIYEAMVADPRFAEWRFIWAFREVAHAEGFAALADPRTTIVQYRTSSYYRAFGAARVWVSNSIIAPELLPRAGQIYIQTWHGTPLKRIGLDVIETTQTAMSGKSEIDDRYRAEAGKVTLFVSAAPFTTEVFGTAFGLPASGSQCEFVEIGNPRNDALATATPHDAAAIRARLGIPVGKRVVLYAPTWRDDQHDSRSGYVYELPLDIDKLRAGLGEDWVVLFRTHYLVTNIIDFDAHGGFVRDVSGVDDINELCIASDVLVTDYSSVYFDFALLDRPIVFFMYDLDRYAGELRGFYLPVDDVPGPVVTTGDDLAAALLDPELSTGWAARRAELNRRMSPHDDGRASQRVLDIVQHRVRSH